MKSWAPSSGFLKESEYLPYAPTLKGEQVHINHAGCPAGTDTKERLYVKRNEDDSVVAYCHHCGSRGISRTHRTAVGYRSGGAGTPAWRSDRGGGRSLSDATRADGDDWKSGSVYLPRDTTSDATQWPVSASVWCGSVGIRHDELCRKGWGYSERLNRIVIPVFDKVGGGLLGYQTRRLDPNDGTPKYLTRKKKGERLYYEVSPHNSSMCVLVEDALSAEKVGRYVDAIAVLTTTADNVLRDRLIAKYQHIVVWLDDDNLDVRKKQIQLMKMFDPYVKVTVLHTSKDPKRHSDAEIREILKV